jgi:two-component system NtrC family response regulator
MAAHPINVLIIDDEESVCNFFRRLLDRKGCRTVTAVSESEALRALESSPFQVAMVDLKLPDTDGLTLLKHIKRKQPNCEVIIMTGFSTIKTAVKAMQMGAYQYVEKPFDDIKQVEWLIQEAAATASQGKQKDEEEWSQFARAQGFLVGNTPVMRRLASLAYRLARKDISILVQGETGTGKDVLARFIHATSHRAEQMFIPINCGALSDNLLESELFGHERGSFTGAGSMRRGIFELANNGTLFLDEVGEASLAIQVKLLRVLETGEFMRLGGEKMVHSDVRVISASNVDLEQAMLGREFREDLFYRLNVVKLEIPPRPPGGHPHAGRTLRPPARSSAVRIIGNQPDALCLRLARQHSRTGQHHAPGSSPVRRAEDPAQALRRQTGRQPAATGGGTAGDRQTAARRKQRTAACRQILGALR